MARVVRAVGPELELYEACKSDVRWMAASKARWIHLRCAIRKARIRTSSPSGPSLTASAIRIAHSSGLLRKSTRMHSAHLPSTAHRRASAQARRPPRTIFICRRRTEGMSAGRRWAGRGRSTSWNTTYQLIEPARLQTMTMKRRRCW